MRRLLDLLIPGSRRAKNAKVDLKIPLQCSGTPGGDALVRARAAWHDGRTVEALRAVEEAIRGGTVFPGLHLFRAECLRRVGRQEEALAAIEAELQVDSGSGRARKLRDRYTRALGRERPSAAAGALRSWRTALPFDTLQGIQKAVHHYQYRGVPMLKNPFDFALYPMLLWNLKPRTIIEIGSKSGGSALWFGDQMATFGIEGGIVSVDIVRAEGVSHPRVTFLEGDGRNLGATFTTAQLEALPRPWLVIEDADHEYETSSAVLRFFHPWLRAGDYIVVEDGIISDLAQDAGCNSGPHRALKEFIAVHPEEYIIDTDYCDFFGHNLTWCSNGFLRKTTKTLPGPGVPRDA